MSTAKQANQPLQLAVLPLAVLSGIALAFALPPRGISLLGWIALSPMLLASRLIRPVHAAGLGIITAFVCGFILAGGNWREPHEIGNLIAAFSGLAGVLAFVSCAASFGTRRLSEWRWMIFVACAGVTAELLSRLLFPVTIAISQHQNIAALHLSSITGVCGVSFMLWLGQGAFAIMWTRPKVAVAALAAVFAVLAITCYLVDVPLVSRTAHIAAVQARYADTAARLTASLDPHTLVVWPEYLLRSHDRTPELSSRRSRVCLAASFLEPAEPKPYNAVRLISPQGKRLAAFRKQHLFGREAFEFAQGKPSKPFVYDGLRAGIAICFDTEFTDVVRNLARQGCRIVLVPNHDPELPNYLFNYLHAAVIPFRAAENRVAIAWAESNGLSMILAPDGAIMTQAPPGKETAVWASVPVGRGSTIYTRIGDLFAYLFAAGFVALLALGFLKPVFLKPVYKPHAPVIEYLRIVRWGCCASG